MNKKVSFNKNETESKSQNRTLWSVGARKRKNSEFFLTFMLTYGNFWSIFISSQRIEYWINFQNMYNFTYQKVLLHTLFCLFLKPPKVLSQKLRCSIKKVFLKISRKSQEKTCARVSFLIKLQAVWHSFFPMNFLKLLGTPFLQNTSGRLLLFSVSLNKPPKNGPLHYILMNLPDLCYC